MNSFIFCPLMLPCLADDNIQELAAELVQLGFISEVSRPGPAGFQRGWGEAALRAGMGVGRPPLPWGLWLPGVWVPPTAGQALTCALPRPTRAGSPVYLKRRSASSITAAMAP